MFVNLRIFVASLILVLTGSAYADIAIISHPDTDTGEIDTQKVRKIFLGERKSFPNGHYAKPLHHVTGSPDRKEFFSLVLSMTESSHKRHWSRKISTGAGSSPNELSSYKDLLHSIATTPGSIGYIDAKAVDDSVKVLLTVSDFSGV